MYKEKSLLFFLQFSFSSLFLFYVTINCNNNCNNKFNGIHPDLLYSSSDKLHSLFSPLFSNFSLSFSLQKSIQMRKKIKLHRERERKTLIRIYFFAHVTCNLIFDCYFFSLERKKIKINLISKIFDLEENSFILPSIYRKKRFYFIFLLKKNIHQMAHKSIYLLILFSLSFFLAITTKQKMEIN